MKKLEFCDICKEFIFNEHHVCKPEWEVTEHEEHGWTTVRSFNEEDAAEKAVDLWDTEQGGEITESIKVKVRKKGSTDCKTFKVTGEYTVSYNAYEVEENED